MAPLLRLVARSALDLVWGAACAGCGCPGLAIGLVCPGCRAALAPPRPARPTPCPPGLPAVTAAGDYAGPVRALLLAHKDESRLALARPLGAALAGAVAAALDAAGAAAAARAVLVPVPSRRATTRRRGHDPLLRLARTAAAELRSTGRPAGVVPALRLARRVADQRGLDAATRAANLAGALHVPPGLAPLLGGSDGPARTAVVLVDDVLTTGATLAEAARALTAAGAPPAAAAVVAATRRRVPRQDARR